MMVVCCLVGNSSVIPLGVATEVSGGNVFYVLRTDT